MFADKIPTAALLATALTTVTGPGLAGQFSDPNLHVHGYLAQGFVRSSKNNVNGDSTDSGGSLDFREMGANISWRPRAQLLLSAQFASVRQGKVTNENLVLDYAVADYSLHSDTRGRFGARAGQLKLPFGLYNDARDAVHTRPSILLPQSIYLDNDGARAFGYFSLPGAGLYGDWFFGAHSLSLELDGFIRSELDDSAEVSILRTPAPGRFEHRQSFTFRIVDDIHGGRIRLALTASRGLLEYELKSDSASCLAQSQESGSPPLCAEGDFRLDQIFLSAQYNAERWSLTTEIVRRRIQIDDLIPDPVPADSSIDQDSSGFYLQGTFRATRKLSVFARYDERQRELQDRRGFRQSRRTGLPRHYFFARDWTLGGRYDLHPRFGIWAEAHFVDGVAWVNPVDNPEFAQGQAQRHWSLFTVMAAYRF